jgi:predicted AlkP superfamily pyrophosphatase or phosphodiesterase
MAIHFGEIDHAEHSYGTEASQTKEAVRFNDSLVGIITDAIRDAGIMDSTVIIVTGDHGHSNVKSIFSPNVYLAKEGLISDYCWRAKFYSVGGSSFLHLNKNDDTATLKQVVAILKKTPEYRKGLFRILDSKALKKKGANPNTPIALAMAEGVQANNDIKGSPFKLLKPPFHSTHGYDPAYSSMNTMFLAVGKGINHVNVQDMRLVDLAPFIAKVLGFDFDAPAGNLIPGIISKN